jgi:Family of unknown function (DUF5686)/CarboxypepD_reg-like domain
MKNFLIILLFVSNLLLAQSSKVEGFIYDLESDKPLSFANVRIGGTTLGTSANLDGDFSFRIKAGTYMLIFSYIGYKSDSLTITIPFNKKLAIGLTPQAVRLAEVVVNSEDPAYRIVREAIKRKKENRKGLINFDYKAYSKNIISSAGEVAAIEETFLKGYNKLGKWEREFVLSYHKTENQKNEQYAMDFNLSDKYYINFSNDTLLVMQNLIYLPIADNALDHYDYKLLKTTVTDDAEIYLIQVIPQSEIQPLLEGEITIESKRYALNSVNLKTNKGVRFPYINDFVIEFVQQLGLYENYWLPQYVESKASLSVNFGGLLSIAKMTFNKFCNITEYNINQPIPDSIDIAVRSKYGFYTSDTSGNEPKPLAIDRIKIDSLRQIPLTLDEVDAYSELDSTKTMDKLIKVEGALAAFIPNEEDERDTTKNVFSYITKSLFNYGYFRNNRVMGLTFGARYDDALIKKRLYLNTVVGYSFIRDKVEGKFILKYRPNDFFIDGFELGVFEQTQQWQIFTPYPYILNGLAVTVGFDDQFNYYLSTGFSFGLTKKLWKKLTTKLSYISEKQESQQESKYQSIFILNREVRENPAIIEGNDNRVSLNISLGKNPLAVQVMPENGITAQFDISNPSFNSDFDYSRFRILGMAKAKTFYNELFISPYIQLFVDAALVTGEYGPQHIFTPNSAYSVYSPIGVFKGIKPYEYVGTEMIAVHLEHNWRTIPFQAVGLYFIADLHLDIITGVSGLKMWNKSGYLAKNNLSQPYWEAYIGVSRLFAFLRVDTFYNSNKNFGVRGSVAVML